MSAQPGAHPAVDIEATERTELMLKAIVQSSDDAIVSKDLNGIVTSWNSAAHRMFGWTEDEAIGRSIKLVIPPDRHHEEDEVLRKVRAGEKVDHYETVRMRKDGSLIDISLTVSPLRDHTGTIIGASKIARDISLRKAAEAALRQSSEIKDQFLSLVSHELRTPIAIIVGNGHLLSRRGATLTPHDHQQALVDITTEAERLQRIIENLLLLTRVEGGDRIEMDHIQVERILERVIETFARRAPARVIRFEPSRTGTPSAIGDKGLVTSILENLISNADKYSPLDEPIDVRIELGESGYMEIHVLDRGIGLNGEVMTELFEPFYRAGQAKNLASGMGLGLAVCKKAVEEQHGTLAAHPRPGGGSDFWFTLPLGADAEYA